MRKTTILLALVITSYTQSKAQGTLSGDFMMNANFYQRDSNINAANNPLYDNLLSGGEAWLGLRYNYKGFTATVRADGFYNSNLYNPGTPYNGFGLGAWSLNKEVAGLNITVGSIYDQIGSGILFRSYEDRGLLIDNALIGARLKYAITNNISVKGFVGQQKGIPQGNLNTRYQPVIKGINLEGDFNIGEKVHLSPGIAALNRTLDQTSMDAIVSGINSQALETRFVPTYNMYAFTAYNALSAGDFNWYIEGSYKTHEAVLDPNSQLIDKAGNVVYSTLGYARKGIAINLTGKRTENFVMRTSPNETLIRGIMNWQPIVARLRPQRLMARYTPASQDLSEQAYGGDVLIAPNDDIAITLTGTYINSLENVKLYREGYAEAEFRNLGKFIWQVGVQLLQYNQELYQVKPGAPLVKAITPFTELTYKINKKKSLRFEVEYMDTKQDYGSWIFALLEYNIAPKLSFSISDMYITSLNPANPTGIKDPQHYYNLFMAYTKGPHRFNPCLCKAGRWYKLYWWCMPLRAGV